MNTIRINYYSQTGGVKKSIEGKRVIPNLLDKYNYSLEDNEESRLKSIIKALKKHNKLDILSDLNLIKESKPEGSIARYTLEEDLQWFINKYLTFT
jgi:hypothetical protein